VDTQELYCKIFVSTEQDRSWLLQQVARLSAGTVTGRTVNSAELLVDASRNEDYDPARVLETGGFVYFRYYLDVVPADGVERQAYIDSVRRLLLGISQTGVCAVAACDFESELSDSRVTQPG
jgi:hypothetical protein